MIKIQIALIIFLAYTLFIAAISVLMWYRRRRREELRFYDFQDRYIETQLDEMNQIYKNMRGWRHDYHNHMQKIKAHLALGQIDEAMEYVESLGGELAGIDFRYKTGNMGLDAILNSKLAIAEKHGIEVKCDADVPSELVISQIDLCVILGNLIDNALEACDKLADFERRFMRIYICTWKKQLYISVTNATAERTRRNISDFTGKKVGRHGNGLKRIDYTVEKCGGCVNRKNEPGVFATEIMLPMV